MPTHRVHQQAVVEVDTMPIAIADLSKPRHIQAGKVNGGRVMGKHQGGKCWAFSAFFKFLNHRPLVGVKKNPMGGAGVVEKPVTPDQISA